MKPVKAIESGNKMTRNTISLPTKTFPEGVGFKVYNTSSSASHAATKLARKQVKEFGGDVQTFAFYKGYKFNGKHLNTVNVVRVDIDQDGTLLIDDDACFSVVIEFLASDKILMISVA